MRTESVLKRGLLLSSILGATLAFAQGSPAKAAAAKQDSAFPAKFAAARQTGNVEGVVEYTWPNGFRAVLIPDASKATIQMNMVVLVGSRQENYGEHGMAHLFEHMLFKRTKKFASIKQELTKIGGVVNGTTSNDRTNYYEEFPATPANLNKVIELEAERLRSAIVSRDELKTEMTVVRNEWERGENNQETSLWRKISAAAYQWHNYGKPTIGPVSDIENVPNDKLLAWYDTYYQPDNAVVILSGKFDIKSTLAKLNATFGRMPKPKRVLPKTYTVEPEQDGERFVHVRRTGGSPSYMVHYHGPAQSHPDAAAYDILSSVLSTEPSGRLYQSLVATDKAAQVSCGSFILYEPGSLVCDVTFKPGQDPAAARDLFLATLEKPNPFTEAEVTRAKNEELSNIEKLQTNVHGLNRMFTKYAASDWRYFFQRRDNLEKVTAADVARVASKYLVQSNRTLGEYIPTEKPVRAPLAPRAENPFLAIQNYKGREDTSAGASFDFSYGNIEANTQRGTLDSGTKFAFLPKKTRGEMVRLSLKFYLGTEQSLSKRKVDAENVAALLTKGTAKHSRTEFQDQLTNLRAEVQVELIRQVLEVSLSVPRNNLEKALALVGEMLREPAFDAKEFAASVSERVSVLTTQKDEPAEIASRVSSRLLYPRDPSHYLYTPLAAEEITRIKASTLEAAQSFYRAFANPSQATVAVVGDFDPKAVQGQLNGILTGWTASEKYVKIPRPYQQAKPEEQIIETPDKPMAMSGLAQTLPVNDVSPDYPKLEMANNMLGGGFITGRIQMRLREKEGMSYGASSVVRAYPGDESGYFMTMAIFNPKNLSRVKTGFREEIEKAVASGFTAEEFKRSKENMLQKRRVQFSNDATLASVLAGQLALNRTMAFEAAFDAQVENATLPEVNATLKKYIDYSKLLQISVGSFPKAEPAK